MAWPSHKVGAVEDTVTYEPTPFDPRDPEGAEVASDLRLASDALMTRLDRLYELEQRKRELKPDDPEFVRIAREVHDVAVATLSATVRQEQLANEIAELAKATPPGVVDQAIEDIPPGPREAMQILAEWRSAERRLAASPAGSDDERRARADVDRLRAEYARTINLRWDKGLGTL